MKKNCLVSSCRLHKFKKYQQETTNRLLSRLVSVRAGLRQVRKLLSGRVGSVWWNLAPTDAGGCSASCNARMKSDQHACCRRLAAYLWLDVGSARSILGLPRVLEYSSTTRVITYSSNFLLLEYSLISISGFKFPFPVQFQQSTVDILWKLWAS